MSTLKVKNGNTWVEIPAGGQGVPSGGTTGQFLRKSNSTDYATEWSTVTLGDVSSEDVVPVSKGGTGATSSHAASNNLYTMYINTPLIEIPANSDLDNYQDPSSTYYVLNYSVASTILHTPTTSAGYRLIVMYGTSSGNLRQIAIVNGGNETYSRHYTRSAGTWTTWGRILDTNDLPLSVSNGGTGAATARDAALNLNAFYLGNGTELVSGDNLNDFFIPGTFYCPNSATAKLIANSPYTGAGYKLIVTYTSATNRVTQLGFVNGSRTIYMRTGELATSGGVTTATWISWDYLLNGNILPISVADGGTGATTEAGARTNLDLENVYAKESIALGDFGSAAKTITFTSTSSNYQPCLLVTHGTSTARQGLYIVALRRTSAPVFTAVVSASGVTITTETGKLKLAASSSSTFGYIIPLSNSLKDSITIT